VKCIICNKEIKENEGSWYNPVEYNDKGHNCDKCVKNKEKRGQ
jgi:hypothetical protein